MKDTIRTSCVVSSEPAIEPVTLTEQKAFMRVTFADEDSIIEGMITAARKQLEEICNRSFITQTRVFRLEKWPVSPDIVPLPYSPVQSITSVQYVDSTGTTQTMGTSTAYLSHLNCEPARLEPYPDTAWPEIRVQQDDAILITYVAGSGSTTASVPADYRHAIKMLATVLYDDRKGEAAEWPLALKTIIDGMRIPRYL